MRAPFPYFGGKSRIAHEVWRRLGAVRGYVEPFFGSGAVLLGRPDWSPDGPRLIETAGDADGLLVNFWRATAADPAQVWAHADWPPSETDLRARHDWLVGRKDLIERMLEDPEWYDARAAGWWVWAMAGNAIAANAFTEKASVVLRGGAVLGILAARERGDGADILAALCHRLRFVRFRAGDWRRSVQSAAMRGASPPIGIFLDPPYAGTAAGYDTSTGVEQDVWAWAVENGNDPTMRIVVAGYEDGRTVPAGWATVEWVGHSGMGARAKDGGKKNHHRERLWCSPHCATAEQLRLM